MSHKLNPGVYITLIITILLIIWMLLNEPENPIVDMEHYMKQHIIVEFFNSLHPLLSGLFIGLFCLFLCWTVIYYNRLNVGDFPSTPLSPSRSIFQISDIVHPSEVDGFNAVLAYSTAVLVSLGAASVIVYNSLTE
ncbi:uncharacterized protein LOC120345938 [Styela clava]|uniref:ADP-ribosylation factor-like protein 6-interacting protein 6 n=1 Tax=Styela clava TaxID=7725 RepID=UPI00193AAB4F|nr:ADP-ribosylation factor-like protein 6-interacting protein 6 [Styela clava]